MTDTVLIFDGQQLAASGNAGDEQTSDEFSVLDDEELKIQIIGDGASTTLDGKLLGRCNLDKNTFGEYKDVFSGEDISTYDNDSKIFEVDVRGLSAVKLNLVNSGGASTTIDATGGSD